MRMLLLNTLLLCVALLPGLAHGILCYQCNALQQRRSDCPGWTRRPVDSVRDKKDRGGLYTHCVDIRLANGTVLYQDSHPNHPTCVGDFLSVWRAQLVKQYKQDVSAICCEWNRCNGPNATATKPENHFFLHLVLAVIIWTRHWWTGNGS